MKHLPVLLFLLFLAAALPAQTGLPADSLYIREHYTKREVYIAMRDGVRLFTAIYTPRDTTRTYPILLRRTPYGVSPYGPDAFVNTFQNMHLARAGYIFVNQDVRGKYMSEGEFVDVRPVAAGSAAAKATDESTDAYDTADWLIRNTRHHNGRIGVYGISYPGFYASMAIVARHPAIRAVSPQAPVTDWFIGDDFHHNGAFMLLDAFSFYSGFGKRRPRPTTQPNKGFSAWGTPDNYDFFLRAGALRNYGPRFGMDTIPFWNDLMAHPDYDAFWQARNVRPQLRDVKCAVMTVGGLFDAEDCWGAWNTYKALEKQNVSGTSNRIVMGPWVHGGWARTEGDRLGRVSFGQKTSEFYAKNIELPFFEHYLKDQGAMSLPEAYVFETGSNRWTTYTEWPPQHARPTSYFLQPGGQLGVQKPNTGSATPGQGYDEYVSDPGKPVPYTEDVHLRRTREYMIDDQRFAARRPDVLVYQTPVLTEDLTVTGPVQADLYVSTTGTDADFVVKLIDVFPDSLAAVEDGVPMGGYQMLVRGEIMRGRYRNSFEKPEPFAPGQVARVRFELPDVAHTFRAGHRLMVQVQSSWFPLADRNPQQFVNIYQARDEDFRKATHRLWHSVKYPSALVLPVLK
jgi:putative CocE/NonD family hydrolase